MDASRLVDARIVNGGISPLLFKSRDWAYEREWRMFLPKRAEDEGASSRFLDFGESAITGIYVGINHSPEAFAAVDAIPESRGIAKRQIERSYMSYELTSDTFEDLRAGKRKGLLH